MNNLKWKKYHPLTDKNAFICLVDTMGDDNAIVQAARVSYGKDEIKSDNDLKKIASKILGKEVVGIYTKWNMVRIGPGGDNERPTDSGSVTFSFKDGGTIIEHFTKQEPSPTIEKLKEHINKKAQDDRKLIRYLMNHQHTTPFEMVEFKFMVQVPMDCWRQWVRHRTASINEYSTRYTEALDFFQVTDPTEWRLQATDNKQGSSGYLEEWPEEEGFFPDATDSDSHFMKNAYKPGEVLSLTEEKFHDIAKHVYVQRLALGVAKEQARKDLPLSTYTRAYWKCDLHNIFNFLRLRMDSHAQLEIRSFANCMFEIVKQVCPVACEAFEDYVLHAKRFSRMEMFQIRMMHQYFESQGHELEKDHKMTDREWKEFLKKLS